MSKNIHQRLHAVMQKCDYLQKEQKAGMRYKIVSHDKVTAYVRPVLVEHGIVYYPVALSRSQDGNRTEIDLTLRFCNIDDPADFVDVVSAGYGVDEQDKGPGKAISYAVKYALLKALGLETGDDPDEVQDEKANHKPAPKPAATSRDEAMQAFFARPSYEFTEKMTKGSTSEWERLFRKAGAACMRMTEWAKLENDNAIQITHFTTTAAPPAVESFRLFTVAQVERLRQIPIAA